MRSSPIIKYGTRRTTLFAALMLLFFLSACGGGGGDNTSSQTPPPQAIQLAGTGQTTSYAAGDDGDLQKGLVWPSPRFSDNGDGTVSDNLTGLMWLKDANCITTRYPSFDTDIPYGLSQDGMVTWQHALDFVVGINAGTYANCAAGHGDWRLPNVNELESLLTAGQQSQTNVWLNASGFINVQSYYYGFYWSGTTAADNTSGAWGVHMHCCQDGDLSSGYPKTTAGVGYVLPVRGTSSGPAKVWQTGQSVSYAAGDDGALKMGAAWPSPRFTDNNDGTVTDSLTDLMWTQDAYAPGPVVCNPGTSKTWQDALNYVSCLNVNNYAGHADWRLPNRRELSSLVDYSHAFPTVPDTVFTNVFGTYYWSSTSLGATTAWYMYMSRGERSMADKVTYTLPAWPVRTAGP